MNNIEFGPAFVSSRLSQEGFSMLKERVGDVAEMPKTDLEIIKELVHEQSEQDGQVTFVGQLAPTEHLGNYTGKISVDIRIKSGEITNSLLEKGKNFISKCYVKTVQGATERCIDGRKLLGYDDNNPAHFNQGLGPQSPGGSALEAIVHGIVTRKNKLRETDLTLVADIAFIAEKKAELGYAPGDHTDDTHAEGKTGCRAIDAVEDHCTKLGDPNVLPEVGKKLEVLMGSNYRADHFEKTVEGTTELMANEANYIIAKTQILQELKDHNPGGVPVLTGVHNEVFIIVNMVKGTTLHRDHFSNEFDGVIQAFNYDAWHTIELAEAVFPDDPGLQSQYIHTRLSIALTALMDLTDGTLELEIRTAHDVVHDSDDDERESLPLAA